MPILLGFQNVQVLLGSGVLSSIDIMFKKSSATIAITYYVMQPFPRSDAKES